jgi:hypothetical protein
MDNLANPASSSLDTVVLDTSTHDVNTTFTSNEEVSFENEEEVCENDDNIRDADNEALDSLAPSLNIYKTLINNRFESWNEDIGGRKIRDNLYERYMRRGFKLGGRTEDHTNQSIVRANKKRRSNADTRRKASHLQTVEYCARLSNFYITYFPTSMHAATLREYQAIDQGTADPDYVVFNPMKPEEILLILLLFEACQLEESV